MWWRETHRGIYKHKTFHIHDWGGCPSGLACSTGRGSHSTTQPCIKPHVHGVQVQGTGSDRAGRLRLPQTHNGSRPGGSCPSLLICCSISARLTEGNIDPVESLALVLTGVDHAIVHRAGVQVLAGIAPILTAALWNAVVRLCFHLQVRACRGTLTVMQHARIHEIVQIALGGLDLVFLFVTVVGQCNVSDSERDEVRVGEQRHGVIPSKLHLVLLLRHHDSVRHRDADRVFDARHAHGVESKLLRERNPDLVAQGCGWEVDRHGHTGTIVAPLIGGEHRNVEVIVAQVLQLDGGDVGRHHPGPDGSIGINAVDAHDRLELVQHFDIIGAEIGLQQNFWSPSAWSEFICCRESHVDLARACDAGRVEALGVVSERHIGIIGHHIVNKESGSLRGVAACVHEEDTVTVLETSHPGWGRRHVWIHLRVSIVSGHGII
mmetsp:Transcript_40746/g.68246  ORF Transcript_40746/g.68246 Transcript_40746/m.68246 type:complete len:435 (-) Transcript_40746:705-2009(-)